MVADGYGVGGADAFDTEVSFDVTTDVTAVVEPDEVGASGVFYYEAVHRELVSGYQVLIVFLDGQI